MLWGFLLQLMRGNSRQLLFLKEELIDKKVSAVHQVLRMRSGPPSTQPRSNALRTSPGGARHNRKPQGHGGNKRELLALGWGKAKASVLLATGGLAAGGRAMRLKPCPGK